MSHLDSLYLFWCLHFENSSVFPVGSNFFELGLYREHSRNISHVIIGVCPKFFIGHTLLDNSLPVLNFKSLNGL